MEQIKPDVESFARIRVIGVGGSGKNATNHMINSKVKGVEFIAVNSDAQDLHHSLAKKKIHNLVSTCVRQATGFYLATELLKEIDLYLIFEFQTP